LTKPPGAGFAAPVIPRPASAAGVGLFGAGLGAWSDWPSVPARSGRPSTRPACTWAWRRRRAEELEWAWLCRWPS